MQDTVMLKWHQVHQKLRASPSKETWQEVKEHEKYMVSKGFTIKFNEVISPTGEVLWKRQ